jgi:hypothetical protein
LYQGRNGVGHQSKAELETPTPVANRVTPSKDGSGSNSDAAPVELYECWIIRPAASYKSPYDAYEIRHFFSRLNPELSQEIG